jgi:glycosyltransferase involved in cell wall biosynthesis
MTLSPPHPDLRACVVLPARDEEDLIATSLRALAAQTGIEPDEYEVLLVLDGCTDATAERAREVADDHPQLRLHPLEGPGLGSGHARRAGMDAACERLTGLGRPQGLIASTDADTVVAHDWLSAQLDAIDRGARAIGGRIELGPGSLPQAVVRWHSERGRSRHQKLLAEEGRLGAAEHWQFSGASLALTAETYARVGGLEPRATLEDEGLEQILRKERIPIERLLSVRATTSSRLEGRASQGLAYDLAAAAARLDHNNGQQSVKYSKLAADD